MGKKVKNIRLSGPTGFEEVVDILITEFQDYWEVSGCNDFSLGHMRFFGGAADSLTVGLIWKIDLPVGQTMEEVVLAIYKQNFYQISFLNPHIFRAFKIDRLLREVDQIQ